MTVVCRAHGVSANTDNLWRLMYRGAGDPRIYAGCPAPKRENARLSPIRLNQSLYLHSRGFSQPLFVVLRSKPPESPVVLQLMQLFHEDPKKHIFRNYLHLSDLQYMARYWYR